ncbi:MAG: bacillithiol biosynthesis BshC, partial [Armatimonadetes bacterium]|nr:bacillithiol biosynthesis BshC [Armatimonadota bacterium]
MTVEVVERRPLAEVWTGAAAVELLRGGERLRPFYRHPLHESALDSALAERDAQTWRADPAAVSLALTEYHERFAPHPAVTRNLARLAEPATRVVVTGQQAAPFGGPLYTLYKALGAIDAADRLEARGIPAVPLFWLATEDDDYAEARSAWVAGRDGALLDLCAELPHRPGQPVGGLALTPEWVAATAAAVRGAFPGAAYGEELAGLTQRLAGGRSLGDCAAAWLLHFVGERGLVVLDPALPALRALALPLIDRLLEDPLGPTRAANDVGAQLEAAGFRRQLHREPDLCPFYLLRDGARQRVRLDGSAFVAGEERFEPSELRDALHTDPARLSCSVLLRPVVQDYLLNTAAFLVGPGEIAYLAQVGPTYEQLGIARPLLLPRRPATVLEPKP